jgi:hypothetical protein
MMFFQPRHGAFRFHSRHILSVLLKNAHHLPIQIAVLQFLPILISPTINFNLLPHQLLQFTRRQNCIYILRFALIQCLQIFLQLHRTAINAILFHKIEIHLILFIKNSEFCQQAGNINYTDCILLPSASWSHELLHTLGIGGHANSLDCGNETLLPSVAKINAYGNCFSLMGECAFATHPDIRMKEALGWVSSDQIVNFTTSGDYDNLSFGNSRHKGKGVGDSPQK